MKNNIEFCFYLKNTLDLLNNICLLFLTEIWSSFRYSHFRGKFMYFSVFLASPLCILNCVINSHIVLNGSALGISQLHLLDRCVSRTDRPKTRKSLLIISHCPSVSLRFNKTFPSSCVSGTGPAAFSCETLEPRCVLKDLYFQHSYKSNHPWHDVSSLPQPVMSDHGLLTTVAYKLGRDKPACYALEVQYVTFT